MDLILGLNGFVWVSKHVRESEREGEEGFDAEAVYSNQNDVRLRDVLRIDTFVTHHKSQDINPATRTAIARVCNILRVLAIHFVPITDTVLADAYEWALEQGQDCGVKELLREDYAEAMVLAVTARAV